MWRIQDVKSIVGRRGRAALVVACLLVPCLSPAQTATTATMMDSGLFTFLGGHTVLVTVTEVGVPASARIRITLYDAAERTVSRTEGTLGRGSAVRLALPLPPGAGVVQLRASIVINPGTSPGSVPFAVVEDIAPAARGAVTASGTVDALAPEGGTVRTCARCYAPQETPRVEIVPPCSEMFVRRMTSGG